MLGGRNSKAGQQMFFKPSLKRGKLTCDISVSVMSFVFFPANFFIQCKVKKLGASFPLYKFHQYLMDLFVTGSPVSDFVKLL